MPTTVPIMRRATKPLDSEATSCVDPDACPAPSAGPKLLGSRRTDEFEDWY
jgi:hypothetical protein